MTKILNKRYLSAIFTIALSFLLLTSCSSEDSLSAEPYGGSKLSVVATIFPAYDFTREVAGNKINLQMLLPPGTESHSFDPTPQDIISIQNCNVFIYTGGESETWVDGVLDSIDTSGITILSMMDIVELYNEEIREGMEGALEDTADETEYDEHVWTSPVNAAHISETIAEALCALDEGNAEYYTARSGEYAKKLEELDGFFRNAVETAARKTLVFGDRFPFRYFVEEYGLDYFAAFPGCSAESEASAKTIAFLIDKVKEESIPVVFYIEFSSERTADILCESTGAAKLLLHSCHNVSRSEFERGVSYLELMYDNLENLKEALS